MEVLVAFIWEVYVVSFLLAVSLTELAIPRQRTELCGRVSSTNNEPHFDEGSLDADTHHTAFFQSTERGEVTSNALAWILRMSIHSFIGLPAVKDVEVKGSIPILWYDVCSITSSILLIETHNFNYFEFYLLMACLLFIFIYFFKKAALHPNNETILI